MNIFFFTHASPQYLPETIIDSEEVVCGPNYNNLRTGSRFKYLNTPLGVFDIESVLQRVGQRDQPDVVMVHSDVSAQCLPTNLPSNCIKLLLIGGATHVGKEPLQKMIRYAQSEPFDAIFVWNRHNAHFFTELGFSNVFWMPGLTFAVPRTLQHETKDHEVCFFGQLGKLHPRRTRVIRTLTRAGIQVAGGRLTRQDSLDLVARSRVSLNSTLNGEFNLRVFESTQNGALLFNDLLSHYTGLQFFYKDGESLVTYKTAEEIIDKIKYYRSNKQEADRIAKKGKEVTERCFSFEARRAIFFGLLQNGDVPSIFRLAEEPRCRIQASTTENKNATFRRVQIYELAQEIHRKFESPQITLSANTTPFIAIDLADLPRLNQFMAMDHKHFLTHISPLLEKMKVPNLQQIDPRHPINKERDLLVTTINELKDETSNSLTNHKSVCVWDFQNDPHTVIDHMRTNGYIPTEDSMEGTFQRGELPTHANQAEASLAQLPVG